MFRNHQLMATMILLALLLLAGCSIPIPVAPQPAHASTSRVFFTTPADGTTVSSPVQVSMSGEFFTVEPAGTIHPGAGHLHILVDSECIAPGQVIIKDETHIHYGAGQLTAELELTPGEHTLCLQAADGAHFALSGEGMTETITITVE
ncbi:MAG: DUF4399 domain-containing protein [Caldilineaceae bacterium]|nr:DUF4399 domain-containing protein [Caldilineaceae bacterium]